MNCGMEHKHHQTQPRFGKPKPTHTTSCDDGFLVTNSKRRNYNLCSLTIH